MTTFFLWRSLMSNVATRIIVPPSLATLAQNSIDTCRDEAYLEISSAMLM
jgi:hypothetical protein